ncbi:hypothetical protein pqer_cds_692 [Pandoravirus quercus]|uniref:Uncharacterized protein n=1 Tax=Pandoravirus quercus TaxID=2107709 RepID=A0A2U7U9K7_9VIRU|nr:hypothetical protein pqer_cds_692 [Pandoravirus quercus]AVK75114.1 hypothetical protein pqer_cds_692 [Pandoravirus quercus]
MPALPEPETDAETQRIVAAFALPYHLVGADAQVRALRGLTAWLASLPVGLPVDTVHVPTFQRIAAPLEAMYNPALLARVKALYMPFWTALASILVQAPDVRIGLDWPPTPASVYDFASRYLQDRGLLAPAASRRRDVGADLDYADLLALAGLNRLEQVIWDIRTRREAPVFGPVARTSAQRQGLCDPQSSQLPYFMVVALGRDGRAVALLATAVIGTRGLLPLALLNVRPDGSRNAEANSDRRFIYPRALNADPALATSMLDAAVAAVRDGRPWRMGLRRMTTFGLPDQVAVSLLQARLSPPYYGIYFDECDAAPLVSAAQGQLGRVAAEALYPPRTLMQASAARVAADESYGVDVLENVALPPELEESLASYVLLHACASEEPPGIERLAPAAALVGIDPNDPIYRSSPTAFCGDVWTAIDDRVRPGASIPTDEAMTIDEGLQGSTAEPPRSRQRLF